MLLSLLFSVLYLSFSIWILYFYALILCVLNFELFGFWLGYVLFMILVGCDLYFVIALYPLHYYICFDSQVLWLFYVAKGGEKWGV